jgi:hypothetical protein
MPIRFSGWKGTKSHSRGHVGRSAAAAWRELRSPMGARYPSRACGNKASTIGISLVHSDAKDQSEPTRAAAWCGRRHDRPPGVEGDAPRRRARRTTSLRGIQRAQSCHSRSAGSRARRASFRRGVDGRTGAHSATLDCLLTITIRDGLRALRNYRCPSSDFVRCEPVLQPEKVDARHKIGPAKRQSSCALLRAPSRRRSVHER